MLNKIKKHYSIIILSIILIIWTGLVFYFSPVKIVQFLGITNSYLIIFLLSFFGGTSIIIAFPYYLFVIILGAGGLNPLLLGLAAGTGVILGDSISYLVGLKGKTVLPNFLQNKFKRLHNWLLNGPPLLIPGFLFLYGAFIPIPNDIIVIPLGLAQYPYFKLIIPLGFGNILFNIMLASLGYYRLII